MDVIGEDLLLTSNARKLFSFGKAWIEKHWKAEGREISRVVIKRKLIGRNEGFRMVVSLSDPCEDVTYYAKIQSPHIDTVITHYLLQYTHCGPEEFLTVLLDPAWRYGWYYVPEHGVVTREIAGWRMASSWSAEEKLELTKITNLRSDSFLLTFMIHLGRFGNIPNNRDNWGLVHTEEALSVSTETPRLKLVDFSAGGVCTALRSKEAFLASWFFQNTACVNPDKLYSRATDEEDLMEWLQGSRIEAQIQHFPWLQSQNALLEMMEQVCHSTELWLQDMLVDGNSEPNTDNEKTAPSSPPGVSVAGVSITDTAGAANQPLLQAYKHNTRPDMTTNYCTTMREMVFEYERWIEEWDGQLKLLCNWFPFAEGVNVKECSKDEK